MNIHTRQDVRRGGIKKMLLSVKGYKSTRGTALDFSAHLVEKLVQGHVDLDDMRGAAERVGDAVGAQTPFIFLKAGDDVGAESLVKGQRQIVVAQMIGEDGKGQLPRSAAVVSPFEAAGGQRHQVKAGGQGVVVDGDLAGIGLTDAPVDFHGSPASGERGWERHSIIRGAIPRMQRIMTRNIEKKGFFDLEASS